MSTKILTKKTKSKEQVKADLLAEKYLRLREQEEKLAESIRETQDAIKACLKDGQLKTAYGVFELQARKSYSWPLDAVKLVFPSLWLDFTKSDDKKLRERMETRDEAGCLLEASANVKVVHALVIKKAE